jgi:hypothetical protein
MDIVHSGECDRLPRRGINTRRNCVELRLPRCSTAAGPQFQTCWRFKEDGVVGGCQQEFIDQTRADDNSGKPRWRKPGTTHHTADGAVLIWGACYLRAVNVIRGAFYGLARHLSPWMLLKLRFLADSIPSALTNLFNKMQPVFGWPFESLRRICRRSRPQGSTKSKHPTQNSPWEGRGKEVKILLDSESHAAQGR